MAFFKVLILSLFTCIHSHYSPFTLKSTVPMPVDGDSWMKSYDPINHEIWLLNPYRCAHNTSCYIDNDVISYNIKHETFRVQSPTTLIPSGPFQMWGVSNWAISIGNVFYFNAIPQRFASYDLINSIETEIQHTTDYEGACLVSSHNRYIFMMGGSCCDNTTINTKNYFKIYDIETNTIHTGNNINIQRKQATCQIYNGIIYIIGGSNDEHVLDSIETLYIGTQNILLNMEAAEWTILDVTLNVARRSASSVICEHIGNDLIYIIGGINSIFASFGDTNIHSTLDTIEVFNMNDDLVTLLPFRLNEKRAASAVMCIDQYIYVMGGSTDGITLNSWEISNALYTEFVAFNSTVSLIADDKETDGRSDNGIFDFFFTSIYGILILIGIGLALLMLLLCIIYMMLRKKMRRDTRGLSDVIDGYNDDCRTFQYSVSTDRTLSRTSNERIKFTTAAPVMMNKITEASNEYDDIADVRNTKPLQKDDYSNSDNSDNSDDDVLVGMKF